MFIVEEKPINGDSVVTERLLLRRLESVDEWSLDGDSNGRRTNLNDWQKIERVKIKFISVFIYCYSKHLFFFVLTTTVISEKEVWRLCI